MTTGGLFEVATMSNAFTYLGLTVTEMDATGPIVTENTTLAGVGATSLEAVPVNCAVLVRKNTASGGRRNRGRLYMPPAWISEGNIGPSGTILSTFVTAVQVRANTTRARLVTSGQAPMVLHSDGAAGTLITNFSVDGRLATQRRRMR
jgi:hypothetical protein